MLQNIRHNINGVAAKIIIGLIVLTFSIFGIESILVGGGGNSAAKVNGEDISAMEVQQLVQTQTQRLMQMMGDQFNPALIDEQALQSNALESLISRKLLVQDANELALTVPDVLTNNLILSMEQFKIDGQFSRELYTSTLSGVGFTPASFKKSLSEDLLVNQLRSGYMGTDFVTQAELAQAARTLRETRDIRYFTLPLDQVMSNVEVSPEDIQAYYNKNQDKYRTTESVDVDYIELLRDDFIPEISEDELLEAFELEKDARRIPAQRRVSHILFQQGEEETTEAFNARVAAVESALAAGADFAEQAKVASDDKGSGAFGGDLGYTSGDTLPAAMESAIAELELNAVSGPVVSESGTHLIKVTDIQAERSPELADLRGEIQQRLQNSAASRELLRVVEELKDAVYNAEDLDQPASDMTLQVKQVKGVTRNQAAGLFASPALNQQLFSEEVFEQGHNSEVVELDDTHFVVARVRTVHPAEVKALNVVKGDVTAALKLERGKALVAQKARQALTAMADGETLEAVADKNGQQWQVQMGVMRNNIDVPAATLARAFTLPAPMQDDVPVSDFVVTENGDVQVLQLIKVSEGQLLQGNKAVSDQVSQAIASDRERLLNTEFQNGLRDRADISLGQL